MPALRIQLFGKFSVTSGGREVAGLDAAKSQELLCYLLVNRARPQPRETLAALLWGDAPTDRSKKYLRQSLWHIQNAFDAHEPSAPEVAALLRAEHDWVQLEPGAGHWLDLEQFERAFEAARGEPGGRLSDEQRDGLAEAVSLYRGDLLEGWYQDWCLFERERLQNIYLLMLDKLMSHCEARSDRESAQTYGALILRQDRARERTHRQLMQLHHLAGDRTSALRQYARCVEALGEELGVAPDRSTTALYEQIRAGHAAAAEPTSESAHDETIPPAAAHGSLNEVLANLRQLQQVVADAQQRIQQNISSVEHALRKKPGRVPNRQG